MRPGVVGEWLQTQCLVLLPGLDPLTQLCLAAICHLHQRVLLLVEQNLHPLHISIHALGSRKGLVELPAYPHGPQPEATPPAVPPPSTRLAPPTGCLPLTLAPGAKSRDGSGPQQGRGTPKSVRGGERGQNMLPNTRNSGRHAINHACLRTPDTLANRRQIMERGQKARK